MPSRPPGSAIASYQSPPTRVPPAPGAMCAASETPTTLGSRSGSSARCRVAAIRRSRSSAICTSTCCEEPCTSRTATTLIVTGHGVPSAPTTCADHGSPPSPSVAAASSRSTSAGRSRSCSTPWIGARSSSAVARPVRRSSAGLTCSARPSRSTERHPARRGRERVAHQLVAAAQLAAVAVEIGEDLDLRAQHQRVERLEQVVDRARLVAGEDLGQVAARPRSGR